GSSWFGGSPGEGASAERQFRVRVVPDGPSVPDRLSSRRRTPRDGRKNTQVVPAFSPARNRCGLSIPHGGLRSRPWLVSARPAPVAGDDRRTAMTIGTTDGGPPAPSLSTMSRLE